MASREIAAHRRLEGACLQGKYTVEQWLSSGGFGAVYLGTHRHLRIPVAIKLLKRPPRQASGPWQQYARALMAEGQHLAKLRHDGIVRVYDIGALPAKRADEYPTPYVVMEWVDGEPLHEWLHLAGPVGRRLSEAKTLQLLLPVLDAMAHAHRRRVVHRDLKPQNLLMSQDGSRERLIVLDFGLAKLVDQLSGAGDTAHLGAMPSYAGTPSYMAPEQVDPQRFGRTGPWTDVHALGLIAVEMVCGRRALLDRHDRYRAAVLDEQRPTPRSCGVQVSDGFERLCQRALALRPADRFADAGAMLEAWRGLRQLQPEPAREIEETVAQGPAHSGRARASTLPAPAPVFTPCVPTTEPMHAEPALVSAPRVPTTEPMHAEPVMTSAAVLAPRVPTTEPMHAEPLMAPPPSSLPSSSMAPSSLAPTTTQSASITESNAYGRRSRPSEPSSSSTPRASYTPPSERGSGTRAWRWWLGLAAVAMGMAAYMVDASSMQRLLDGAVSAAGSLQPSNVEPPHDEPAGEQLSAQVTMVDIPAGEAVIGTAQGSGNERAPARVSFSGFSIDRHEVTVRAYRRCVAAGQCKPASLGQHCNAQLPNNDDHPINCVSFWDAERYCSWAGKTLPTELQWEIAARGSKGWRFPWGKGALSCERAVMLQGPEGTCDAEGTSPVGSRPKGASPYGVLDMAGNVWEFTRDVYRPGGPFEVPPPHANRDERRVLKGGSWRSPAPDVRATHRFYLKPWVPSNAVGFRCVRPS